MSDMTIDDAPADANVTGVEKLPCSDAGAAKALTVNDIKDFTLAKLALAAEAAAADIGADKVLEVKDGAVMRVSAQAFALAVLDYAFGLPGIAEPNGNEVIAIKDANIRKTITLDQLRTWLEGVLELTAQVNVAALPAAALPVQPSANHLLIEQGTSSAPDARRMTAGDFASWCLGRLAAFVAAQEAAQNTAQTDTLPLVQSGVIHRLTVAQLKSALDTGDVKGPAATTEHRVPQWDAAAKTLKNGLEIASSIATTPSGTRLASEGAVRTLFDSIPEGGDVKAPETTTSGKVPSWSAMAKTLADGYTVVDSVTGTGATTSLTTERAVASHVSAQFSAIKTEGKLLTWDSGGRVADGMGVITDIVHNMNDNVTVPTTLAVQEAFRQGFYMSNFARIHAAASVPAAGGAGYTRYALLFNTSNSGLYINTGTDSACLFQRITAE